MKPVQLLTRALLSASVFTFAGAASCDGGEIADTGVCPDSEICSGETPKGLRFQGATIAENLFDVGDVKTLAQGGSQHVRLLDAGTDADFAKQFEATVEANLATVAHNQTNQFTLHAGQATGDSYLRITEPATGALFDRLRISVAPVTKTHMSLTLGDSMAQLAQDDQAWVAPGGVVYVRLDTTIGAAVDESMELTGSGTQTKWDRFVVGNPLPGTTQVQIKRAGQQPQALTLKVVAAADSLKQYFPASQIERGVPSLMCFHAFTQGHVVHVPWQFETSNGIVAAGLFDGCTKVTAAQTGSLTLTVHAGTLTQTFNATVIERTRAAHRDPTVELQRMVAASGRMPISLGDSRGERANLVP